MLSVFLCNSKSEKCPEGGAQKAAGGTALDRDKESGLEVIMGGAPVKTGELELGGTPGHQRSARNHPGRENKREKGFLV